MLFSNSDLNDDAMAPHAALWCLRICLAIQCFGVGASALGPGTAINSLLFGEQHLGGFDLSERSALLIDQAGGAVLLIAGVCILLRPCWPVLIPVAIWQLLIALASVHVGGKAMSQFGLMGQSLLYVAPLALMLLAAPLGKSNRPPQLSTIRVNSAIWMLRLAAAAVFTTHGVEAILVHPVFVDYLIGAADKLLTLQITQATAETSLRVIGLIDIALAVLILVDRWWPIAAYMAFWGIVTALSRVVCSGWGNWPESAMRSCNGGVPLAIAVYWFMLSHRR